MSVLCDKIHTSCSPALVLSSWPLQPCGDGLVVDVLALGAMCEIDDLTTAPRTPTLDEEGYVKHQTPELDTARARERLYGGFGTLSPEVTMTQRRSRMESVEPSFYAEEFADMSDGRRVLLKDDRGWSSWSRRWPQDRPSGSWTVAGGRALTKQAILVLDPDDNEYWMDWVVGRLRFLGFEVDTACVQAAPFHVEFGPRLLHVLHERSPEFSASGPPEDGPSGDKPPLSVVALGAVCELAYLTDPPRRSTPPEGGYAYYPTLRGYPTPEELRMAGPQPGRRVVYGSYYEQCSPQEMQAERWSMFESGMRELHAEEFADLSDGRRVVLKDDRRWDFWPVPRPVSSWRLANGRELTRQTIMMLDPRHNDEWEDWVVERLRTLDVDIDLASVHAAPFRVEFGPRVQHELRQRRPAG